MIDNLNKYLLEHNYSNIIFLFRWLAVLIGLFFIWLFIQIWQSDRYSKEVSIRKRKLLPAITLGFVIIFITSFFGSFFLESDLTRKEVELVKPIETRLKEKGLQLDTKKTKNIAFKTELVELCDNGVVKFETKIVTNKKSFLTSSNETPYISGAFKNHQLSKLRFSSSAASDMGQMFLFLKDNGLYYYDLEVSNSSLFPSSNGLGSSLEGFTKDDIPFSVSLDINDQPKISMGKAPKYDVNDLNDTGGD